jgi:translation initiation factor 2B subunit (eIF-2B alpha/beta/delta family)
MMLTPEFEALLNDQEAGASSLLYRYLAVLSSYFSNEKLPQKQALDTLETFYQHVSQAHPLMAIFPNLHDYLTRGLAQGDKNVLDLLNAFRHDVDNNIAATVETAKGLFFECNTVFTFSHSSVVRKAVLEAKNAGAVFTIHTTVARPVREGVNLAKVLARAGIGVTLFTDAAMELAVRESDLILVGTDWYSQKGFVNKIGTHSALRMAKAYGKPFIILTDSTKQMDYEPENWAKDEHASSQILAEQIENIQVRNPYFEWIPFQGVSDLIVNGKRLAAKDL